MSVINTNVVKHVLEAFVEEFIVDIPADHTDGKYCIELSKIEEHVTHLSTEDLTEIMLEAEGRYSGV